MSGAVASSALLGVPASGLARALEQQVDTAFDIGMAVLLEVQLRNMPERQPRRQFVPQETARMVERSQRLSLLALVTADCDFDSGVPRIRTDVDVSYIDCGKTRIVHFKTDDFRELFAHGLGNTCGAPFIHKAKSEGRSYILTDGFRLPPAPAAIIETAPATGCLRFS